MDDEGPKTYVAILGCSAPLSVPMISEFPNQGMDTVLTRSQSETAKFRLSVIEISNSDEMRTVESLSFRSLINHSLDFISFSDSYPAPQQRL